MAARLLPWGCNLKNNWAGQTELVAVLDWFCPQCKLPQLGDVLFWPLKFYSLFLLNSFWLICGMERDRELEKPVAPEMCYCPFLLSVVLPVVGLGLSQAGLNVRTFPVPFDRFLEKLLFKKRRSHLTFKFMHKWSVA